MEEKKRCCGPCKKTKPLSEFSIRSKQKGTRQPYCKECKRTYYGKRWYARHKDEQIQRRKKQTENSRLLIRKAKSVPCVDCGKQYHWYLMDMDHLRDKFRNISQMPHKFSFRQVEAEIEKCEVVCSMCHRVRTWNREHPDSLIDANFVTVPCVRL